MYALYETTRRPPKIFWGIIPSAQESSPFPSQIRGRHPAHRSRLPAPPSGGANCGPPPGPEAPHFPPLPPPPPPAPWRKSIPPKDVARRTGHREKRCVKGDGDEPLRCVNQPV